jgi:hypothetical protein
VTPAPPANSTITIDATALSYQYISVQGVPDWKDARQLHQFTLDPGVHALGLYGRQGQLNFTVTPARRVDYDTALDGIFAGRGSARLVVGGGVRVSVDVTALSYSNYSVAGNFIARDQLPELVVVPGVHELGLYQRRGVLNFVVTDAGGVDYESSLDGIFAGRGSARLVVGGGVRVSVDVTALSYSNYSVAGNFIARDQLPELGLLPGAHVLALYGRHGWLDFTVTDAGRIDYDTAMGIFTGRGSTTLTVHGRSITIDARTAEFGTFSVPGVADSVDARQVHSFLLVPGVHSVVPSSGTAITFTVTAAGNIDYDASLDNVLDGRGTPTLVFRGPTSGALYALIPAMPSLVRRPTRGRRAPLQDRPRMGRP